MIGNRFDEMREKIGIAPEDRSAKEQVLYSIIDELEKIYNELRQGFTKPE